MCSLDTISQETSLYFEIFQKKGEKITKYSSITQSTEEMPAGTYIETAGFNGISGSDQLLLIKICSGFSQCGKEGRDFVDALMPMLASAAKLIAAELDSDSGLMRS